MKATEKLTIHPLQKNKVGNRVYFWVTLQTEKEARECCFSRYNNTWCYEEGDTEPDMSDTLKSQFHGEFGNKCIQRCYKTGTPTELVVDFFTRINA